MKYLYGAILFLASGTITAEAALQNEVTFVNETEDTTRINDILIEASEHLGRCEPGKRVVYIGKKFLNAPYVAGTLDANVNEENLIVDIDHFDCTTYVETVLAMAYTLGEGRTSWRDFIYNLQRMRYIGGEIDGYASRLHYPSQWVVDNVYRGNLTEVTNVIPTSEYKVKTIDFMTRNRDKYPALSDSLTFERMKNAEISYRSHRFPMVKSTKVNNKEVTRVLKDGDVVLITTNIPGLDVQHMGIIVKENEIPYLMHASSAAKEVVIEKVPLGEYLRKNRTANGIRIVRLKD